MSSNLASWNYKSFDLRATKDDIIENGWKIIEDLTTNAYEIQQHILDEILTQNIQTEYLDKFLHENSGKKLFKDKVPIINYEGIQPFIDRIVNGESSDIILAEPIVEFTLSSGTSGGKNKIMPMTAKELDKRTLVRNTLPWSVINKFVDGLEHGKGLYFFFVRPDIKITPCGLRARPSLTGCLRNSYFLDNMPNLYTSPYATILCSDMNQSMFCQLLCGLLQRDKVSRIGTSFANVLDRVIRFLIDHWRELCDNIRTGHVSDWITDLDCRNTLSLISQSEPNPKLADSIEGACSGLSWEGIIKQLWPGAKYVDVIITGSMSHHVPTLEFYCGGIPLVSTFYAASEGFFGINLEPFSENISYTLLPNMAFYEFLPIKEQHYGDVYDQDFIEKQSKKEDIDEPVELLEVEVGKSYEIVVTTFTGLYRYKVGDILKVTGFHNNAPQFRFVGRHSVTLSISSESTTEEDLLKALTNAKLFIEPLGFILTDFTSYAHIASTTGHYVLFWELKKKTSDESPELDVMMMEECCNVVEESLDCVYKMMRNCNGIGPLEIRVVKNGSFDALMEFFISNGTSIGQYKTPRSIKSEEALKIMDSRVIGRYFSRGKQFALNLAV